MRMRREGGRDSVKGWPERLGWVVVGGCAVGGGRMRPECSNQFGKEDGQLTRTVDVFEVKLASFSR
jgi:hypothetical protein